MAVFAGFIAYQLYRYTFTPSLQLLALIVLDFVVIALIYLAYRALRSGRCKVEIRRGPGALRDGAACEGVQARRKRSAGPISALDH